MAQVTWIGEDVGDVPGPSFTTCYGIKFPKGVPVEVSNQDYVRKAKGNPYFVVDGEHSAPRAEDEPDATVIAPEFVALNDENPEGEQVETDINKMKIAQLRELAGMRGMNAFGLTKGELRDALTKPAKPAEA